METKDRISKKTLYAKVLPMVLFVIITVSVISAYYAKLRKDEMQLLQGQVKNAVTMYSSYIERRLECIEHRADLAAKMIEKGQITSDEAIQTLVEQGDLKSAAVVSALGIGNDIYGDSINLPAKGFSGLTIKDDATYFYGGDGLIYILKPIKENGNISNAIVAVCDASTFDDLFVDYTYSGADWLVLQNADGKIIYTLHGDAVDYLQQDSNFINTLHDAGGTSSIITGLKRARSGSSNVVIGGENRQIAYHYIKDTGWVVMLGVCDAYFDGALKPYNRTLIFMLLSLFGCMVLYMAIVIFNNMLDRMSGKKKSAGLLHLAETDQLTGLYNKVTTERKIQEFIEENPDLQSMLFVLDIDNFKKINDTMGHAFGDEVLREIGLGLKQQFRASDIIGRAGGDEFIILLKNLKEEEYIIREAQKLESFFRGLQVGTYTKYSVTASIGCAIFSRDGDSFEKLYKQADEALYKAKQRGKNQLAFYKDPEGFGQNV